MNWFVAGEFGFLLGMVTAGVLLKAFVPKSRKRHHVISAPAVSIPRPQVLQGVGAPALPLNPTEAEALAACDRWNRAVMSVPLVKAMPFNFPETRQ